MQEVRLKVKLTDEEYERLEYLKYLLGKKTNASLLKFLLRIKL